MRDERLYGELNNPCQTDVVLVMASIYTDLEFLLSSPLLQAKQHRDIYTGETIKRSVFRGLAPVIFNTKNYLYLIFNFLIAPRERSLHTVKTTCSFPRHFTYQGLTHLHSIIKKAVEEITHCPVSTLLSLSLQDQPSRLGTMKSKYVKN